MLVFVGRDEIRAPLKTPAWEARIFEDWSEIYGNTPPGKRTEARFFQLRDPSEIVRFETPFITDSLYYIANK